MERGGPRVERELAGAKQEWLAPLRGRVLELGPGLGTNLPYLSETQWTGLEPSAAMRECLLKRGQPGTSLGPGTLLAGTAEEIPLPDASFDAVVSTLVLCSVAHAERALAEVRRVLKPGGVFVFIEHVAAEGAVARAAQHLLRPVCGLLGCSPVRRTGAAIARAGFASVEQRDWPMRASVVLPHIVGRARVGLGGGADSLIK